ncbi:hypothetical protein GDO81_022196 [Engystomops pustulosus]|uniref:Uncharacterized protein n=1 Tax=Engystomops pustulosus TaxID=76066 RepID=A0AAV6YP28_ENGPU|nr:hypothetical protein GDO81_022196 [Engystomops pustulosus]
MEGAVEVGRQTYQFRWEWITHGSYDTIENARAGYIPIQTSRLAQRSQMPRQMTGERTGGEDGKKSADSKGLKTTGAAGVQGKRKNLWVSSRLRNLFL